MGAATLELVELDVNLSVEPTCEFVDEDGTRCTGVATHVTRYRCWSDVDLTCDGCVADLRESIENHVNCACCGRPIGECWWVVAL